MSKISEYSVGKIKTFIGNEGHGCNAVIFKGIKPVAFVLDDASGGGIQIYFTNPLQNPKSYDASKATCKAEEKALCALALDWYKNSPEAQKDRDFQKELDDKYGKDRATGSAKQNLEQQSWSALETWFEYAFAVAESKRQLDRHAKKKTLFRIKGERYADGEYRTVKKPYDASVQQFLDKKYPGQVTEIYGVTR